MVENFVLCGFNTEIWDFWNQNLVNWTLAKFFRETIQNFHIFPFLFTKFHKLLYQKFFSLKISQKTIQNSLFQILVLLYRHNSLKKCVHLNTNLAARYQYSENVRTLRFLVPAFAGLGALNLLAALSLPYIYFQFAQGESRGANIQLVYQVSVLRFFCWNFLLKLNVKLVLFGSKKCSLDWCMKFVGFFG